MAMYSRRTLLKFYSDTFKTEYTDVAILKNAAVEFLAKENEYGTVLFYNKLTLPLVFRTYLVNLQKKPKYKK